MIIFLGRPAAEMNTIRPKEGDVSEDGHPCEAALEFRRAAIRYGVIDEIPADVLDLAVAYAWIGKAVSRTAEAAAWQRQGIDPNTWQMVRAMASGKGTLAAAHAAATREAAAPGFQRELAILRASVAFSSACGQVEMSLFGDRRASVAFRTSELSRIAAGLPGAEPTSLHASDKVVRIEDFRKSKGRA